MKSMKLIKKKKIINLLIQYLIKFNKKLIMRNLYNIINSK